MYGVSLPSLRLVLSNHSIHLVLLDEQGQGSSLLWRGDWGVRPDFSIQPSKRDSPDHWLSLVILDFVLTLRGLDHQSTGDSDTRHLVTGRLGEIKVVDFGVVIVGLDFGEVERRPRVSAVFST